MDLSKFEALVARLEAAVDKLPSQASQQNSTPEAQLQLAELATGMGPFIELSKTLGAEVLSAVQRLQQVINGISLLSGQPYSCKEPQQVDIDPILKQLTARLPLPPKKLLAHVQACESAFDICGFIMQKCPSEFATAQLETVEYYNNRVRLNQEVPSGREWAQILTVLTKAMVGIIDKAFGNKKIKWIGQNDVKSQSLTPTAETKPVVKEEPKKEAPKAEKKPPQQKFDSIRRIHVVENFEGGDVEVTVQPRESVQIFNCTGIKLKINGKVNMMGLQKCSKCNVQMESAISQVDVVHCQQIKLHVAGTAPTFNIETSKSITVLASNEALNAEFNHQGSEDIKIVQFEHEDQPEFLLPTHFVCKIIKGKVISEAVDVGAE